MNEFSYECKLLAPEHTKVHLRQLALLLLYCPAPLCEDKSLHMRNASCVCADLNVLAYRPSLHSCRARERL